MEKLHQHSNMGEKGKVHVKKLDKLIKKPQSEAELIFISWSEWCGINFAEINMHYITLECFSEFKYHCDRC